MNTINKKAYIYKMKLVPANILGTFIFILLIILSIFIANDSLYTSVSFSLFLILMILYLCLHEIIHGIGYLVGGSKWKNIQFGMAFEKGILYCMSYQEVSKKNILISLQMPFMVIGVITYIIGIIFSIPLLVILSIINLVGASMDIVMFLYILKLKDVIYSESGEPDEFALISSEDLTKKKSLFFKIVEVKDYKKSDYEFNNIKKIVISKWSWIILLILLLLTIVNLV